MSTVWDEEDRIPSTYLGDVNFNGLSVVNFGATGDGLTDDTSALEDAFVSPYLTQGLYFPAGTYLTTGSHIIPSSVTIDGPGKIKRTGVSSAALLVCGDESVIKNITLDGSGVTIYCAQISGDKVKFLNCTIEDSDLYGIGNSGYDDLIVSGCRFLENDSYGVLIEGATARCQIIGNHLTSFASDNGQGFFMKSTGASNEFRPVDGIIAGNIVDVRGVVAIEYWGDRGSITGNIVRCGTGVIGISIAICTETSVTGNTITSSEAGSSYGIEVAEASRYCTVSGNTVIGMSVGVIIAKGSRAFNPEGHTVSGNTIRNCTSHGINLEFAQRCNISGNTIDNCLGISILLGNGVEDSHNHISSNLLFRRAGNPGNGISASGTHLSVVGNHIDHSEAVSGFGISLGTGADYGFIQGNHIIGCSDGIVVSGTHTYIDGNMTLGTTGYIINMGVAADYNIVGSHFSQNDAGAQITVVGVNSRLVGPAFNRGLNRAETRSRIGFETATIGAATTPGSVVKKVEVFDQAGASIGFIPIYDAIA